MYRKYSSRLSTVLSVLYSCLLCCKAVDCAVQQLYCSSHCLQLLALHFVVYIRMSTVLYSS